jgi:transposase
MKLTSHDYGRIADSFPRQRGNVTQNNLNVLNAMLYMLENGCKWRALPNEFGNWHSIYTRMNRWSKNGVLHRVFERLQRESMLRIRVTAISLDSTSIRVHPNAAGALKKTVRNPLDARAAGERANFIWLPRMLGAPSCSVFPAGRKATRRMAASCSGALASSRRTASAPC